jgi:hypothetical protein
MFYGHLVCFMDIWSVVWTFGLLYGQLVCCIDIWYIMWQFGNFFSFWSVVPRQNLATLAPIESYVKCKKGLMKFSISYLAKSEQTLIGTPRISRTSV